MGYLSACTQEEVLHRDALVGALITSDREGGVIDPHYRLILISIVSMIRSLVASSFLLLVAMASNLLAMASSEHSVLATCLCNPTPHSVLPEKLSQRSLLESGSAPDDPSAALPSSPGCFCSSVRSRQIVEPSNPSTRPRRRPRRSRPQCSKEPGVA